MITREGRQILQAIAQAALASIGHCYFYSGAPGPRGLDCWDCSSATNWWIGAVAGQAIPDFPAGTYDGREHGPSTLGWLGWIGQGVYPLQRQDVGAGDIICWTTHMGVAVSNTEMVSALNPTATTLRTAIDGLIAGEQMTPMRLLHVDPSESGLGIVGLVGTAGIERDARAIARSVRDFVPLHQLAHGFGAHGFRL